MPAALVAVVLLAAWLGAAVLVAAVVAPAAFAVMPSRPMAGELIGRVLPALFWSGIVVGAVVAVLGRRLPSSLWRPTVALTLLGACALAQLVVAPRIRAVRAQIGDSMERIETSDPRRIAFGQLHTLSVAAMGVGALAAALTLVLVARSLTNRSAP